LNFFLLFVIASSHHIQSRHHHLHSRRRDPNALFFSSSKVATSFNHTIIHEEYIDNGYKFSNWINDIDGITDVSDLVIPGTHNSGTYPSKSRFYKCQNLSISEQLEIGVRYFDFRVKKKGNDYLIHNSIATYNSLRDELQAIYSFMDPGSFNQKNEFVIVKIRPHKNDQRTYDSITNIIKDVFKMGTETDRYFPVLYRVEKNSNINGNSLKDFKGKVLFLWDFVGDNVENQNNDFIFDRKQYCYGQNPSSRSSQGIVEKLFESRFDSKAYQKKFFLSYLTLRGKGNIEQNNKEFIYQLNKGIKVTTNLRIIFLSKTQARINLDKIYFDNLFSGRGRKPNIVIVDFINKDNAKAIIDMNGAI